MGQWPDPVFDEIMLQPIRRCDPTLRPHRSEFFRHVPGAIVEIPEPCGTIPPPKEVPYWLFNETKQYPTAHFREQTLSRL
jgi:hypothetical protein